MVNETTENNKRIAKNTLILYIRMLFVMLVSLYTSRVVLNILGVEDFGIYNVVGGVVVMMNVINSAMSVSTQRYLTFELGKKNLEQFKKTFSLCMTIFIGLSILIVILGETIGLWFVNEYLVIPQERMVAANWVYQFAVFSCVCSLLNTPYNATIIANEKMQVYAYISIVEVILKLAIVYLLIIVPFDKLASYGALTFVSSLVITLIYHYYCTRKFKEARYEFNWDKKLFHQLAAYSGWNLFGSLSGVAKGQGLNILINMFFGPSVNAARGIAYQVNGVVSSFFSNFYMAVRPQITKYYAQDKKEEMYKLVFNSSKMSFFLIILISLPIVIEAPVIIKLWLGQTPEYVVPFMRIIIMITAIDAMSTPLMTAIHATGKNRTYQLAVGIIMIMTLPISYVFLKLGYSAISVFIVSLILSIISLFVRLYISYRQVGISFRNFTLDVIFRSFITALLSSIVPLIMHVVMPLSLVKTILVCLVCIISTLCVSYLIGLNSEEKKSVIAFIRKKISVIRYAKINRP